MKHLPIRTVLLWCVLWMGPATADSPDEPINLNRSLTLTEKQRLAYEAQAAQGSGEAAIKVAMFYGFVALNPREQRRWTQIGAENGDTASQYNMYQDLIESDSAFDRARAVFWLRKAAAKDPEAKKELEHIEHEKGMEKARQ